MSRFMKALFNDASTDVKGKVIAMYLLLLLFNVAAWAWALIALRAHPLLMGTAFLAYSFGLRHAVDADHIAAIDNVTRKLMQEGKRPVAAGFFFSLGHSTIVVTLSLLLAAAAAGMKSHFAFLRDFGGVFGVTISVAFLFAL